MIGRIVNDPSKPGNRFEGYAASSQNDNKILRDVFEKGDAWFRTGDLMRKDERRLFLFRRPRRRHLPLEGRERLDLRGRRGDQHLPRHRRRQRLWRHRGRPRRPRRHGGDRLRRRSAISRRCTRICRANLPDYARPAVPAHPGQDRRHRHVQAEEGRSGAPGLRSGWRPTIRSISTIRRPCLRAARSGALSPHRERRGQVVIAVAAGRARVLARGRPEQMVQRRTARSTPPSGRTSWKPTRRRPRESLPTGRQTAEGALALVIVLDQFPRNMFRGDARTFAADPLARAVADRALGARLRPATAARRPAVLLPAVRAFRESCPTRSDAARCLPRPATPNLLKWAQLHADIIRRFGRFPHRNAVLGRATTPEEQAFLDGGGFTGLGQSRPSGTRDGPGRCRKSGP